MKTSIKAVLVIVIIALFSAVLLSILNDVLYVSDAEKDDAKLNKVYNSPIVSRVTGDELSRLDPSLIKSDAYGEITGIYNCQDGTIIIKAKGNGGYSGGWVECFVAINSDGVIKNVVVNANKNQSFIGSIKQSWLDYQFGNKGISADGFTINKDITPAAGATRSSTAVTNSVNMAMHYFTKSTTSPEDEIKAEIEKINSKVYQDANITLLTVNEDYNGGDNGVIKGVWKASDGTIIIKARGFHGYDDGYVECYVAIGESIIKNVYINSNSSQTLLSKYDEAFFNAYYINKDRVPDNAYVSGATKSGNAIKNSVDIAFEYINGGYAND